MVSPSVFKVMVVDDDTASFEALSYTLRDICIVVGCASAKAALAAATDEIFPVAIIDLRLNSESGLDVLMHLKIISPLTQNIILTGHQCAQSAIEAINCGAIKYLLKPFERSSLVAAISEGLRRYNLSLQKEPDPMPVSQCVRAIGLSPRHADVAEGILNRRTNKEIAKNLGISQRTVEKHVEKLLIRFGVSSRFLLESKIKESPRYIALLIGFLLIADNIAGLVASI